MWVIFIMLGFLEMDEIRIFDVLVFILFGRVVWFVDNVDFCSGEWLFIILFRLYDFCGLISLIVFLLMLIGSLVFLVCFWY